MKLRNKLDAFQTHNIHFVMLAARNTEDLRVFTDNSPTGSAKSLAAIDRTNQLGDQVQLDDARGVYLMIDTRRYSQFSVDNFELQTNISGFEVQGSATPSATATAMSFTVTDNIGISFANFLQYLMDQKLGVSFDGMTILVRILFVGEEQDGSSRVISSVSIPAIFNKITLELNATAGVYACTLYPMVGMPTNSISNAKWTSVGSVSSFKSGTGDNTLGGMVNSFEARVNQESLDQYNTRNSGKDQASRTGRLVQYMITIPDSWKTFTFAGPSGHSAKDIDFRHVIDVEAATKKSNAQKKSTAPQTTPSKEPPPNESFLAVDSMLTIPEILDIIFASVPEVAKLGNFTHKADEDGLKFYKHLVSVTCDDASYTVHVDVVEYSVPNADLGTKNGLKNQMADLARRDDELFQFETGEGGVKVKVPKNYIELDYLFSGTNLDVLSMDLKFENLNVLLLQGVKLGAGAVIAGTSGLGPAADGEGSDKESIPVQALRQRDPVLLARPTGHEQSNFKTLSASSSTATGEASPTQLNQQYIRNLSAYYNAGPINVKTEIRGNPEIFERIALQTIAKHVSAYSVVEGDGGLKSSSLNDSVKADYRRNFERDVLRITPGTQIVDKKALLSGPSYLASSVYVKINIYAPAVDFKTNTPIKGGDFAQKLFYDNYYFLTKVVSKISGAKFTQDFELKSFSVYQYPTVNATPNKNEPGKK